jgi:phosphatidate cytidylyltransferase
LEFVLPERTTPIGASGARWGDLRTRVLSAAVLAPAVLLCIWWGGLPYALMMLCASLGLAWEWVALCGADAPGSPGLMVLITIATGASCAVLGHAPIGLLMLVVGTILTAIAARLADRPAHWRALAAGVPYIGAGVIALIWLRADIGSGLANILFLLALVWASDIGAYLIGRVLGGPKLAPTVSPGKTWSGAMGGLFAAVAVAMFVTSIQRESVSFWRVAGIAAVLGVVSQSGDLLESLIKRHFGVKDSSQLIPGHGGFLDRLDALLIAAPFAALLALMAGRGVSLWQ